MDSNADGQVEMDEFIRCCLEVVQQFHLELSFRVFFHWYPPSKSSKYKKLISTMLGVSRPIYVNVDSPKLGFPYFNFLGGYQ